MYRSNESSRMLRNLAMVFGIVFLFGLAPQAAFAAGGGGGGGGGGSSGGNSGGSSGGSSGSNSGNSSSSNSSNTSTYPLCGKGKVWSTGKNKCVELHSSIIPDDQLTDYAFALAEADRYAEALDVLDTLVDPNTPKALNYRGYATRHLGRLDEGISYYLKSVALDPKYPQVREYLGEAYVIKGRIDLAQEQLDAIKALCGTECEYYEDLADAIANPSGI